MLGNICFVGQIVNLRPIGNRPLNETFRATGRFSIGGRLPTCPQIHLHNYGTVWGFIELMQLNRPIRAGLAVLSAALVAILAGGRAPTQTTPPPPPSPGLEKIQHFVFIMQENRSFDHYFGTYPGAEGLPPGVCIPNPAGGACAAPFHDSQAVNQGGAHNWANAPVEAERLSI